MTRSIDPLSNLGDRKITEVYQQHRRDLDGPEPSFTPKPGKFGSLTRCEKCGALTYWRTRSGLPRCPKHKPPLRRRRRGGRNDR